MCVYRADEQRNKREREERSKEIELCVIQENPPLELQCISDPLIGTNKWLSRAEELHLTSDPLIGANKRPSRAEELHLTSDPLIGANKRPSRADTEPKFSSFLGRSEYFATNFF